MRAYLVIAFPAFLWLISCSDNEALRSKIERQQAQIDSLRIEIEKNKPGLGEIMSGVQIHHAKLWFAGTHSNWKLADFEIGEIKELLANAQRLAATRKEVKNLEMIFPAIDTLSNVVQTRNHAQFEKSFRFLTDLCNRCHQVSHFEFNVVTIPTSPPVFNQDFTLH
jgi:hypothetical protein